MVIVNLPWSICASPMAVSQMSHWLLTLVAKPIFLFPALPSCPFSWYCPPVSSDFSFSAFLSKNIFSSQFCKFSLLPPAFTLNCTAGVISSSTEQGQPSQIPFRACPSHFLPPLFSFLWLCVVICSSQEPCCFLPSVLFALTLVVLLSDPHQVLSNPLFLQLLMSCRPMAQICRSSPHVNTSMTRCCLSVAASYKPALGVVFTRIK